MSDATHVQSPEEIRLEESAAAYLGQNKQWKPGEYRLESHGATPDGRCAVVWAIHREDEQNPTPGNGRSLELHIDRAESRWCGELRFQ